ncbi:SPOR domain-containing protein [Sphingopyxis sp. PAMC25046]|uniref:SPOR domain-containing protein n=1 Tax=Sphingopyxis sp. PAMC25046 TaxID=2565556 RepID=UPI00109E1483|nr:SPOR domain-containing protein [Sphingopyxis sp. PAMC25046]QCB54995.1 SPOR domain-containing protein [Sphingopyxis sp. PAMC25046]
MVEGKDAGQGDTGLGLDDEGRLPWLEAADGFEEDGEVSPVRLLVMVLGGLLLIGAVLGGLWWIQNGGARGKGELIAAQQGDYKVAPETDGAKTFEGEGDAAFSASEGAEPAGKVDPARMPEEPAVTLAEREAAAKKAVDQRSAPSKSPPPNKSKPTAPATAAETRTAVPVSGEAMIQLGAFSSEGAAAKAWSNLSKRFAYLAELSKSISPAKVGDGTVYRLRVSAGTAANATNLCGKLRVAGENCVVVR